MGTSTPTDLSLKSHCWSTRAANGTMGHCWTGFARRHKVKVARAKVILQQHYCRPVLSLFLSHWATLYRPPVFEHTNAFYGFACHSVLNTGQFLPLATSASSFTTLALEASCPILQTTFHSVVIVFTFAYIAVEAHTENEAHCLLTFTPPLQPPVCFLSSSLWILPLHRLVIASERQLHSGKKVFTDSAPEKPFHQWVETVCDKYPPSTWWEQCSRSNSWRQTSANHNRDSSTKLLVFCNPATTPPLQRTRSCTCLHYRQLSKASLAGKLLPPEQTSKRYHFWDYCSQWKSIQRRPPAEWAVKWKREKEADGGMFDLPLLRRSPGTVRILCSSHCCSTTENCAHFSFVWPPFTPLLPAIRPAAL